MTYISKTAPLKEFSKDYWAAKVETYHAGLTGITDVCWEELLDACKASQVTTKKATSSASYDKDLKDDNQQADLSMLDNNCASLFNFCSPALKSHATWLHTTFMDS